MTALGITGGQERTNQRPWCCPEPRCEPLINLRDGEYKDITKPEPGHTWTCWGALAEPIEFVYDGVRHSNDLTVCHYTALKGVLRFQDNAADWNALATYYHYAGELVKRREPVEPEGETP